MSTAGGGRTSTCTAGTSACEAAPAVGLCMCGRAAPGPQADLRCDTYLGCDPVCQYTPRLGALVPVPLRPAASEGEGTGPVEVMPTTLVDWSRLYRDCGLRRTEEYHRVALNRIGTNPERKLLGGV